jgi:hypothetical protein
LRRDLGVKGCRPVGSFAAAFRFGKNWGIPPCFVKSVQVVWMQGVADGTFLGVFKVLRGLGLRSAWEANDSAMRGRLIN